MKVKPSHPVRILTCCYCGARSTLPAGARHNLVCHGCGAPVARIEHLQPQIERVRTQKDGKKPSIPHRAEHPHEHLAKDRPARRRKGKYRRRSVWYRLKDAVDDWDDLFDLFD